MNFMRIPQNFEKNYQFLYRMDRFLDRKTKSKMFINMIND